ncbi:AAA family ATPase [Priestia megaterium]|uniref:AAA family ATPase n=1 Tax=Priestia megaterium TaxID=1404 RepID=UPI003458EE5A
MSQLSLLDEENGQNTFDNFYSIRTKTPESVSRILAEESSIEIEGINLFENDINLNQPIFIVLGGDKAKSEVYWNTGLIGIGKVIKKPYDSGYSGRNYRIQISIELLMSEPLSRHDLLHYANSYNIIGIGPMTKWEPNQAISRIEQNKAVTLVRAMLDKYPLLEDRMKEIFGESFMQNVIEEHQYLIPYSYRYGEYIPTSEEVTGEEDIELIDIYEPDFDNVTVDLKMNNTPIMSFKNYINIGKHIIFTGPPGTGKTTLAENAGSEAKRINYITDYTVTTATADWSTFETIGGYMPNSDGKLEFEEGIFLKSIRENKWLIIDEFNRADADKAFGQLFTVLSGKNVELPFKDTETNHNISIKSYEGLRSYYNKSTSTYWVGRNWRVIGTMNTFDKNSLYEMSFALMRRFAFVNIPVPDQHHLIELINSSNTTHETKQFVKDVLFYSPTPIGPAVLKEFLSYIEIANEAGLGEALCGSIFPQFEGLLVHQIEEFYKRIMHYFSEDQKKVIISYLNDFFELTVGNFEESDDEFDN